MRTKELALLIAAWLCGGVVVAQVPELSLRDRVGFACSRGEGHLAGTVVETAAETMRVLLEDGHAEMGDEVTFSYVPRPAPALESKRPDFTLWIEPPPVGTPVHLVYSRPADALPRALLLLRDDEATEQAMISTVRELFETRKWIEVESVEELAGRLAHDNPWVRGASTDGLIGLARRSQSLWDQVFAAAEGLSRANNPPTTRRSAFYVVQRLFALHADNLANRNRVAEVLLDATADQLLGHEALQVSNNLLVQATFLRVYPADLDVDLDRLGLRLRRIAADEKREAAIRSCATAVEKWLSVVGYESETDQ